ncbi:MAG: O-antigen ligase family protein [Hyphomicrobiales bacterium]|nr:O-antigen ligase family protein [Hyphomicrobiales bacterium]
MARPLAIQNGVPAAKSRAGRILPGPDWWLCVLALTGLEFLQYSQTPAAYTFTAASALCALREPGRALQGALHGGLIWLFIALWLVSMLWSPVPDLSFRSGLQVLLTVGGALIMVRALPATYFISALMFALLVATVASLADPREQLNYGGLAMVGIFGSKNQFGLSQALLLMVSSWVLIDVRRTWMVRVVALVGIVLGLALMAAARSLDSTAVAIGALACSYCAFRLNRFAPRWRPLILIGLISVIMIVSIFLLIFGEELDLIRHGLEYFGKDTTLTGRTVLWDRAAKIMEESPFLGTGAQGFWVEGNPYAEELWARFQPGRSGYNFHNLWYETGVQFGYVGLILVFWIIARTSLSTLRWAMRTLSVESCFFLAFVIFVDVRTFVESELLSQFSMLTVLLVAAWFYARGPHQRHA